MMQFDTTRKAMTQITVVTALARFAATFAHPAPHRRPALGRAVTPF
jgi:hypothetical protein